MTDEGPLIVSVGATFVTKRSKLTVLMEPSLSLAVMVTAPPWSGPSAVAYDQVHVPPGPRLQNAAHASILIGIPGKS